MLQYSLEVGICWAILYLVYIVFLRRETFFAINRWYLLSSLVLGLLIPVLRTIPIAFQEEVVAVNEALYFIAAGPEFIATNIVAQPDTSTVFTLNNFLLLVYSLGVLFVGCRLVLGLAKIKNLYSTGSRTRKHSFTLVETNTFHLPFSFLNCVFFSKEMPINDSIEKILKHELTHVQSWHTLDVLFTEVLQVLFWFNPLIILYKKAIKESHEYVADASVLEDTSQKIYGQILLRQSQSGLQIALANHFFHSHIKKRLTMMKQEKSKRPAMLKYLFALPVILLLMILFQSQTLPDNNLLQDSYFEEELGNTYNGENAHELISKVIEKELQGFLVKKLRSDFVELYHATDHNKNIMQTVQKFNDLLKSYTDQYPSKHDEIKNQFKLIGQSMGVKIGFTDKDLDFQHFMFIVPKDRLEEYQKGLLPEYELMIANERIWETPDFSDANNYYILIDGRHVNAGVFIERKFEADVIQYYPPALAENKLGKSGLSGALVISGLKWGEKKIESNNRIDITSANEFVVINSKTGKSINKELFEDLKSPYFKPLPISKDEIWKQINSRESIKVLIDDDLVSSDIARSLKSEIFIANIQYDKPSGVIEEVKFVSSRDDLPTERIESVQYLTGHIIEDDEVELGKVFKVVEEMPHFPGCEDIDDCESRIECAKKKMLKFIYTNLEYPQEARVNDIEGLNVIQFIVEADGRLTELSLVRDIGGGTGEETMKVMKKMQAEYVWTPGYQKGKAVRVLYTFPIKFKLDDTDIECCDNQELVDQKIYRVVDEMPRFPGCEDFKATKEAREQCSKTELLQFVYRHLDYPKEAREKGIDGTAVVQFVIDKKGNVINPKVARDIDGAFEESLLTLMEEIVMYNDPWMPGKQNGKPVDVLFTLPVKYLLEEGTNKHVQLSQNVKQEKVEDPNNIETWITGLAPEKVLNIKSTSTLSDVVIDFYTDKAGPAKVSVFDMAGQLLTKQNINVVEGKNQKAISINASVSGMYVVTIQQDKSVSTRKVFLK